MDIDGLLVTCVGFEDDGEHVRFFLDSPTPEVSLTRERGVRTPLFRLYAGDDAREFREYIARHRCWEVMRVPTYDREKGVQAVRTAGRWRGGDGSAISDFGRDRVVRDDGHRERLHREVELLVGMVLGNPVKKGELEELHELQDAINAGPVGVGLCTLAEAGQRPRAGTHGDDL